jgi:hypothetical protein
MPLELGLAVSLEVSREISLSANVCDGRFT